MVNLLSLPPTTPSLEHHRHSQLDNLYNVPRLHCNPTAPFFTLIHFLFSRLLDAWSDLMSNFFDDSDDEQQPGGSPSARSASAVAGGADDSFSSHRAASPRPYHQARPRASEAGGRVSSTTGGGAGGGGRQSSVTGGASGYYGNSTRGGSPNLDDILGGDDDDEFGGGVGADEAGESNMDRLIRAWNNEIGAPEVLRFPKRLVERVTKDLYRRVSPPACVVLGWGERLMFRVVGVAGVQKQLVAHAVAQKNAEESLYLQANLVAMENLRATHVLKSLMRERLFKVRRSSRSRLRIRS